MRKVILLYVFIIESFTAISQTVVLPYSNFYHTRNGLIKFINVAKNKKIVTVAFVGGSITYNPGWRQMICSYFIEKFPNNKFHFIAGGIPSLGSVPHAFRLKRDILDSGKIDLMFLEAAVNDRVNGTDSLSQIRALEGIVRHAKTNNPQMDIIMMAFADPYKNTDYDSRKIPAEIANQELVAARYELPSINLAKEVHDKIKNKEFNWEKDFKDLHPAPFGQNLYSNSIKSLLNACLTLDSSKNRNTNAYINLPQPLDKYNLSKGFYLDIKKASFDKNWTYISDWNPVDNVQTREGFVHVPVLKCTKIGSLLTLRFRGTAVGIAVESGPDAGAISYSIDNSAIKTIDLYTKWSKYLYLPWYLLLKSGMKNGSHILKITIAKNNNPLSKGNTCMVVHFLVNK